ncbi:TPA: hypothetical protein DEB02_03435, partial [Candidatus Beckwithbacteria bacterium]|nr:hypothetical protein [Candidatus Beckwithbacteria bacterium]
MDIYREEILDHYKNPRNFGPTSLKASRGERVFKARETNASCGDVMEMAVVLKGGRLSAIKFEGEGCAVSMAAASMLTEKVKGKKVAEAEKMTDDEMIGLLKIEVGPTRRKGATLGLVC